MIDFKYDPHDKEWTDFEEVLENLNNLIKVGKVRYIGVEEMNTVGR